VLKRSAMALLALFLCSLLRCTPLMLVTRLDTAAALVRRETCRFILTRLNCRRLLSHLQTERIGTSSHVVLLRNPKG